jgi:hypothetical protein
MLEWKFRLVILLALAVTIAALLGSFGPQAFNIQW